MQPSLLSHVLGIGSKGIQTYHQETFESFYKADDDIKHNKNLGSRLEAKSKG